MGDPPAAEAGQAPHYKTPEENPANPTLYVRNLSERVGVEELKKSLWQMFNQFGEIVDIYCRPKSIKCKGQAWICFKDVAAATEAKQDMQEYSFYDKKILIAYSRVKSDVIAKEEGTFVPRKKRRAKKRFGDEGHGDGAPPVKQARRADVGAPSKILFVENCPDDRPDVEQLLGNCFTHFPGFLEVRVVPGNSSVAFVEFTQETQAMQALVGLQGHAIAGHSLKLSFPKK